MTRRSRSVPKAKRGEIWMADLDIVAKVRPVLILSVDYRDAPCDEAAA
jgi:mRNA-degrading endonuclease toxin of MazEF toxin-antitoxin module